MCRLELLQPFHTASVIPQLTLDEPSWLDVGNTLSHTHILSITLGWLPQPIVVVATHATLFQG